VTGIPPTGATLGDDPGAVCRTGETVGTTCGCDDGDLLDDPDGVRTGLLLTDNGESGDAVLDTTTGELEGALSTSCTLDGSDVGDTDDTPDGEVAGEALVLTTGRPEATGIPPTGATLGDVAGSVCCVGDTAGMLVGVSEGSKLPLPPPPTLTTG
jgi:hypothetical protein